MYMYLSVSLSLYFCMSDLHLVGFGVHKIIYRVCVLGKEVSSKIINNSFTALIIEQIVVSTRTKASIVS